MFGKWYHFIGIGGAGMSGLARILIDLGIKVSGSDLVASYNFNKLKEFGALVTIGHAVANLLPGVEQVVVSSAVPSSNVEYEAAIKAGIPVITRGELLAQIMSHYQGIAIVGAHGKTTTSSMISLVLESNGMEPTFIIGGEVNDIGGNARLGHGEYLVAEADESDGSFLKLAPNGVVITNIDNDHLDYYHKPEAINEAFQQFLGKIRAGGFAVLCTDNARVRGLDSSGVETITYGLEGHPLYKAEDIVQQGFTTTATINYQERPLGQLTLHVPGVHNVLNALAAIAVGRQLGLKFEAVAQALVSFHGVQRRFQLIAEIGQLKIIDDYAHHPTEIMALLKASEGMHAQRRIAVFQPHRYTRTSFLKEEFGFALQGPDLVIITDIYSAGEQPIQGVNAELIVNALAEHGQNVNYIPLLDDVVDFLIDEVRDGDLVMTIGAGNVYTVGQKLAAILLRSNSTMKKDLQQVL